MEAPAIQEREHAIFNLTVEASDIEPGKIVVRDLARLSELVQRGLERVARVLSGQPGSSPGRLPKGIEDATRLVLVGIGEGSAVLQLELPEPEELEDADETDLLFKPPPRDLGFRAMDVLVHGLHEIEQTKDGLVVPDGWDNSVMEVAEALAQVAEERRFSLRFDSRPPSLASRVATITPRTAPKFSVRRAPVLRRRTARGLLVAVDLGTGRVDVQEPSGGRVSCHFTDSLEPLVKRQLGAVVIASGEEEYDEARGRHGRLELESLEGATEQVGFEDTFWLNPSAAEQATHQQVGPILSVDDLTVSNLFSEEDIEEFLGAIREARSEE